MDTLQARIKGMRGSEPTRSLPLMPITFSLEKVAGDLFQTEDI